MIKKLKILAVYVISAFFILAPSYLIASTRAIQIELLLDGLVSPTTGKRLEYGTVEFYSAGTLDAKNVWTEKEKTNAYTSYTLNTIGGAQLYGEGNYKIIVKDSSGATVQTLDNIRLEFPYYGIRTVTAGTVTMLSEDNYLLCNTTSGDVTINFLAAANRKFPLKVQRISGTNNIIIDPNGSETIDGSATLTISTDAIVEIVSDGSNLRTAGYRSGQSDADGDTKLVFDRSADDDVIRFDIAGVQNIVTIDADGLTADEVDTPILKISGSQITSTPAELNILDGATLNVNDLNIIDGLADSGSLTVAELMQLDGVAVGGNASGDILTTDDSQTLSGKNFSQDGQITITDTGNTASENPLIILSPNLDIGGTGVSRFRLGVNTSNYNRLIIGFNYVGGDGSTSNFVGLGLEGAENAVRADGLGNVGIGKTSGGAKLDVNGEIEGTSLDINGAGDVSGNLAVGGDLDVTGDQDVTGNQTVGGTLDVTGALTAGSLSIPSITINSVDINYVKYTPSAVTSFNVTPPTAGDYFEIHFQLDGTAGSGTSTVEFSINGDSGSNYHYSVMAHGREAGADYQSNTSLVSQTEVVTTYAVSAGAIAKSYCATFKFFPLSSGAYFQGKILWFEDTADYKETIFAGKWAGATAPTYVTIYTNNGATLTGTVTCKSLD